MIKAHEREEFERAWPDERFEDYVASTTVANTPKGVAAYVQQYLVENNCREEVRTVLRAILDTPEILAKAHVVRDGSYRNCVLLVRPDCAVVSSDDFGGVLASLTAWTDEAEIVHLNISRTTWEEVRREERRMWRF